MIRKFSKRFQGDSHIEANRPCQDYAFDSEAEGSIILAVSDGHGNRDCVRSEKGSLLACKVVYEKLSVVLKKKWFENAIEKGNINALSHRIAEQIVETWKEYVEKDLEESPLTDEEKAQMSPQALKNYTDQVKLSHIYGATLLFACYTKEFFFASQIGDGAIVIFNKNGDARIPVEDDEKCEFNSTTSLCNTMAVDYFRSFFCYGNDVPVAVFLCSDGLEKTYQDDIEGLFNLYRTFLHDTVDKEDPSIAEEKFLSVLPLLAKNHSRDDVSIACCYDSEEIKTIASIAAFSKEVLELTKKINQEEYDLNTLNENLNYVESLLNRQKTRQNATRTELENVERKMESLKGEEQNVVSFMSLLKQKYQSLIEEKKHNEEKKEQIKTEISVLQDKIEQLKISLANIDSSIEESNKKIDDFKRAKEEKRESISHNKEKINQIYFSLLKNDEEKSEDVKEESLDVAGDGPKTEEIVKTENNQSFIIPHTEKVEVIGEGEKVNEESDNADALDVNEDGIEPDPNAI